MGILANWLTRLKGKEEIEHSTDVQNETVPKREGAPYAYELDCAMVHAFPGREMEVLVLEDGQDQRLDLCVLKPTENEPYYVLYTSGMSAKPMELEHLPHPERYDYLKRAEMMMYLPEDWPLERVFEKNEPLQDAQVCWPIALLKNLALMPQKQKTWLGAGHCVPNGEPPVPFEGAGDFCGVMLYFPDEGNGPKKIFPVGIGNDEQIMLYVVAPIYLQEIDYKIEKGANALEDRLRELPDYTGFIVTKDRKNIAQ